MVRITHFALAGAFISPIGAEVQSSLRRGLTLDRESLLESVNELYNVVTSDVESKFDETGAGSVDDMAIEIRDGVNKRDYNRLTRALDNLEGQPRCMKARVLAKVLANLDRSEYNKKMKDSTNEQKAAFFGKLSDQLKEFILEYQDDPEEEEVVRQIRRAKRMMDSLEEDVLEGKSVTRCVRKTEITDDIKATLGNLGIGSSFEAPSETDSDFEKLLHLGVDEDGI